MPASRFRTSRRVARIALLLPALVLAACSGDGGTAPAKPASLAAVATTTPTATVGTALTVAPTFIVKDASGNPLGNVNVAITVAGGGGTITGAPTKTLAGATPVGTWTLGTTAGTNSLSVTVGGLAPMIITATGTPGAPAKLVASAGNNQTAYAGASLATPLEAAVQDQYGNGIPNIQVTFQAVSGGGSIAPGLLTTNASGVAAGATWKLGNKGGTQQALANASGYNAAYSANIQSTYPLDLRFYGPAMPTEAQTAFLNAANRLKAAIVSSVNPVQLNNDLAQACGAETGITGQINEQTQGVIIYASVQTIDGAGKILAQAGPCLIRGTSKLPAVGVMEFDAADINNYIATGRFEAIVLHEMNHVLGLGTIWDLKSLLQNPSLDASGKWNGSTNPRFIGAQATAQCQAFGGTASCPTLTGVPVESGSATVSAGTADGHWRESVFDLELMTGFAEATPNMPWSTMSIASFQDLGYSVNLLAADTYGIPSLMTMARLSSMQAEAGAAGASEVVRRPRFEVSNGGRLTPIPERK